MTGLRFAIKICAPQREGSESWGDLHFARAIAAELQRRGHDASIQTRDEWRNGESRACDVVLHLRGLAPYAPRSSQLNLLWCISHPELLTAAECDRFDIVWSASARHAAALSRTTRRPVEVLEQATDPAVFFPDAEAAHARELVFVGNSRRVFRAIVRDLLPTDRDLAIWGNDWEPFVDARHLAGSYLPNDEVRRAYSSAAIVLNDHWDDMREWGFVSNRVYDVLACGGMLLSDDMPELRAELGEAVCTYRTRDELHAHIERLLGDPEERARRGARGRELVLARHTFAQRVDTLLATVGQRLATSPPPASPGLATRLRDSLYALRLAIRSIRQ